MLLSPADACFLFDLARAAIRGRVVDRRELALPSDVPSTLRLSRGCFVTLEVDHDLRGCIGHVVGRRALFEAVPYLAVAAATEDRRFDPIRPEEMARLHVELSVLSPLVPISPRDVRVGVHGLQVRMHERVGLLLPQVATERGWDLETFLAHTCRKAGLPPDTWRRPGVELLAFEAEVHEDPPRPPPSARG